MMEDDLIACLTRQVKEEVIENYMTERRLLEIQIQELHTMAERTRCLAEDTGRRFTRLGFLMMSSESLTELLAILKVSPTSYWGESLGKPFHGGVRFIHVAAFTTRAKFKKLVLESYRRLNLWMEQYAESYRELQLECQAINSNIRDFHNNYDLLAIINFLKSLDTCVLERKHFLGENFSPDELASIDKKLYIKNVSLDQFNLPQPCSLPPAQIAEAALVDLANQVYKQHGHEVKRIVR